MITLFDQSLCQLNERIRLAGHVGLLISLFKNEKILISPSLLYMYILMNLFVFSLGQTTNIIISVDTFTPIFSEKIERNEIFLLNCKSLKIRKRMIKIIVILIDKNNLCWSNIIRIAFLFCLKHF